MTSPQPPSALDGRCSVIYNNILYVYTESALLSLPLEQNAQWNTTSAGQSVTNAVCVVGSIDGTPNNQGIYVVGGTSSNTTYSGLQRYSFNNKSWESIHLNTNDIQNRVNHGAIYIPGSTSILVYAGSQTNNLDASTSTFEIPINDGWVVQTRGAAATPAGIQPVLLPWDNTAAVYVGGTPTNTEVFLYYGGSGWGTTEITLSAGIPSNAGVAIQSNSDGSKFLEIFDMAVTPNNVSYIPLLQTGGASASPGESVTFTPPTSSSTKRSWGGLPSYNGTNAPSTARSSFALAQDDNGLVVISGGSGNDAVTVFNQTQNSWVNTTEFFYNPIVAGLQKPLTTSISSTTSATTTTTTAPTTSATSTTTTSSSTTTTPTSTPTSTTTAMTAGSNISTGMIVGVTLGSLVGVALVLIAFLVLLRYLHQKKTNSIGNGARGFPPQGKDRLSFQDQGIEPLTMSAVPMGRTNVPSAVDSLNMIAGKFGSNNRYSMDNHPIMGRSSVSPTKSGLTTIASSRAGMREDNDHPRGDRSTDEGWGKYFQDRSASDRLTESHTTRDSDLSEMTRSDYRGSMWPHQVPEANAIALGAMDEPRPIGQVPSGSPSTEHLPSSGSSHILHHGHTAHISSADSASFASDDDEHDNYDAFSSGIPQSVHEGTQWPQPWNIRPPSSNYTDSFYQPSARGPSMGPADARSNGRRSSGILHDSIGNYSRSHVNSDMSWLNLNADK